MILSDEQLAARAQQGCVTSFEELVRRYQTSLLQFLGRWGAGGEAEDLLQETFVRVYSNLHRYQPERPFAPWLFTIARRLGINHHRRARPSADGEGLEGVASSAMGPAEMAVCADDRRHLWATAARILSEEEMTAVWLFYVEEMSAREIAAVLERTWVAVKTILFRARRRMLALMDEPVIDARSASRKPTGAALAARTSGGES
jgi:RNA polymerase sigma-70 factor (ECF subfamily)